MVINWIFWICLSITIQIGLTSSGGNNVFGKKEIHLAGIFPINGVEGWQGGQVYMVTFEKYSRIFI